MGMRALSLKLLGRLSLELPLEHFALLSIELSSVSLGKFLSRQTLVQGTAKSLQ